MTIETLKAIERCVCAVLKKNFTRAELELAVANGISISGLLSSGQFDEMSRGEAQKMGMSLESRWPKDDARDTVVCAWREHAGMTVPRHVLGVANRDGALENVADTLTEGIANQLTTWAANFGLVDTELTGFDSITGEPINTPSDNQLEHFEPAITFADSRVISRFISFMSADGGSNPRNV